MSENYCLSICLVQTYLDETFVCTSKKPSYIEHIVSKPQFNSTYAKEDGSLSSPILLCLQSLLSFFIPFSVTKFGDLLDFGQVLIACGNN